MKECLRPFIIGDAKKGFCYRGLSEWERERDRLADTCPDGRDTFIRLPDMPGIPHGSPDAASWEIPPGSCTFRRKTQRNTDEMQFFPCNPAIPAIKSHRIFPYPNTEGAMIHE